MTTTDTAVDFARAERDIRAEIDRLEAAVAALSLESLAGDPDVLGELADLEEQLDDSKRQLVRLLAAREESGRRNALARAEAAAERRTKALTQARRLQGQRQDAARAVDAALSEFAKHLREWDKITSAEEAALRQAGQDGTVARARSYMPECALLYALREAGCAHGIIGILPPSVAQVRPLVDLDFKGLEPLPTAKKEAARA